MAYRCGECPLPPADPGAEGRATLGLWVHSQRLERAGGREAKERYMARLEKAVEPERYEQIEEAMLMLDEAGEQMQAEQEAWAEQIRAAAAVPVA